MICRGLPRIMWYASTLTREQQAAAGWRFVFSGDATAFSSGEAITLELDIPIAGANVHMVWSSSRRCRRWPATHDAGASPLAVCICGAVP